MPLVGSKSGLLWPLLVHAAGLAAYFVYESRQSLPDGGAADFEFPDAMWAWFPFFAAAAVLYFPVIFGLKQIMMNHEAFDLKDKSPVNLVFWWNQLQGVFATVACLYMIPLVLKDLKRHGLAGSVCTPSIHRTWNGATVSFLYAVSKLFELGDTIIIVLRKRPLQVLQYYHHWATMLFVWYSATFTMDVSHCAVYFGTINYFVHACMYTWYAVSATGVRVPSILTLGLTFIQLSQMAAGLYIYYLSAQCATDAPDVQRQHLLVGVVMYTSYLLLFGRLMYNKCMQIFGGRKAPVEKKTR